MPSEFFQILEKIKENTLLMYLLFIMNWNSNSSCIDIISMFVQGFAFFCFLFFVFLQDLQKVESREVRVNTVFLRSSQHIS